MNVNHVNAICRATQTILQSHFGIEVTPLKPSAGKGPVPSNHVSVILGVSGQLNGQIICSFSESTAKGIVGVMMGGVEVETLDDIGWSAVQEFGNWVAGNTATELSKEECIIDVTPPIVNEGASKYHSNKTFISIPLDSQIGMIEVHISVSDQ
ncbi:chemotaxis protein CheX [Alkalihalobacterium chitinilyticum]|uniref:Chemotaxis protein CheX n=1 Tax=Alkalihalobacterium chitinilyticum TaxID=2980103 RepID=A0ABT5VHI2_9BACI|nr:chemotaxis protein CheX [Alkalihalobacterium chitinilyticum]MDE5414906.1 chemotaxis protein CheX [Alkalihalobacterium chitinilyticum]